LFLPRALGIGYGLKDLDAVLAFGGQGAEDGEGAGEEGDCGRVEDGGIVRHIPDYRLRVGG
jgi:hypothetical protein